MQWQTRWKALLDPLLKGANSALHGSPNLVQSRGCGTFTNTLGPFVPVPNLSVDITTTKGQILITLQPDPLAFPSYIGFFGVPPFAYTPNVALLQLLRDGKIIAAYSYHITGGPAGVLFDYEASPGVTFLDSPSVHTKHTYSMISTSALGLPFTISNWTLVAEELGT